MDAIMKQLLVLALWLLALGAGAQRLHVVSVGICDYQHPRVSDLRYTEADVRSLNEVMQAHTRSIYTLLGANATLANVRATLQQVCAQAQPNDAILLFFSGHGYPGGFCCYDVSPSAGRLEYAEIAALFKQSKAHRKMIFADACFSGGLRAPKTSTSSSHSMRQSDILLFLSSRSNETSLEMRDGPNGHFTRFLVRGLTGGADTNRDRRITARELFTFVHEGVKIATGRKQHPVMWGRFDHNMTIIHWNKK